MRCQFGYSPGPIVVGQPLTIKNCEDYGFRICYKVVPAWGLETTIATGYELGHHSGGSLSTYIPLYV